MARADAGHAARQDLAAFLDELRQDVGALVVDEIHLLDAKLANFLFAEILALAARTSAGTAWAAATGTIATRTTFTARTTMTTARTVAAAAGAMTTTTWA